MGTAGIFLRVLQGEDKGKSWELSDRQVYQLGRSRRCNLRLDDRTVSAAHSRVECTEGVWYLSDLDSTHGTLLNKALVAGQRPLFDRDLIQVGKTLMEFREYEDLDPEDLAEIDRGIEIIP